MKKLVWFSGLLLLASLVFPNGITLPKPPVPPQPVVPVVPDVPAAPVDADLVKVLSAATPTDKARVAGIYLGLRDVIKRDAGKRIRTTEQWAELQATTLALAVDDTSIKGKYAGLDVALEGVFEKALGAEKEAAPSDEQTRAKIIAACDTIIASAQ